MNKEQIRKALDHFENDQFTDAKEILAKEIQDARTGHLQNKLDLDEGDYGNGKDKKKKKNGEEDEENGDEDEDE